MGREADGYRLSFRGAETLLGLDRGEGGPTWTMSSLSLRPTLPQRGTEWRGGHLDQNHCTDT